ncbi:hypothetical protein PR003_g13563 [Phytophthora rubi]|uniref:HTH CENPB-type domain-containing protein n=1 Tax=Phytophthora rubi TaxID=129364 RepID=A0A6A3M3W0_9STRA|nr:hypothetical protein PR001_g13027 [Phytophthora rubi]KAE9334346.1 hypothetical protein PR003_g13563 [Phytophthora rubi]
MYPGLDPAARETKRKSIYNWRKMSAKVERACISSKTSSMKRLRPMGTATVLSRDTELQLVEWVDGYRRLGVPVSALMLHFKALDFAGQAGLSRETFAASWAWRKGFFKRHRLGFRARTRQRQESLEDSAKVVEELNKTMKETMHKLDIQEAYNADQTPIFFEYIPKQMLNARGARTVWVRSGGKDKERMTCMLLGSSFGRKFTPFFVIKTRKSPVEKRVGENLRLRHGFGKTLWKEIKVLQERHGAQIYGNSTGWWTSDLSITWLDYHFKHRPEPTRPVLLLWDEFSAHWTPEVKAHAAHLRVHLLEVPGGHTSVCQPADVAWNAPLKQRLRLRWLRLLQEQVARQEIQREGIKPPKRGDVVRWVADS